LADFGGGLSETKAASPATEGASLLAAGYEGLGAAGNTVVGFVQLFGAGTGKTENVDEAATAATTVTSVLGFTAMLVTKDINKASKWAAAESLGTSAFQGGFTGHIIDQGARAIQNFLVTTEKGQSFADLVGIDTTATCNAQ